MICCPNENCRQNISFNYEQYICSSPKCFHSEKGKGYKSIDGTPILVSETTCDTIVNTKNTDSRIVRKSSKLRTMWNKIANQSSKTKDNINLFKRMLKSDKNSKKNLLIIGSGKPGHNTEEIWNDTRIDITGIDIYLSPTVDIIADAHYLP